MVAHSEITKQLTLPEWSQPLPILSRSRLCLPHQRGVFRYFAAFKILLTVEPNLPVPTITFKKSGSASAPAFLFVAQMHL
jgi:hypothetical protein